MEKIREEEILEVIRRNPDVIKDIISSNTNHNNTRKVAKEVEEVLTSEFKLDPYTVNKVKGYMSGLMRMALKVKKAKDIPSNRLAIAKLFYVDLFDLVRKYQGMVTKNEQ